MTLNSAKRVRFLSLALLAAAVSLAGACSSESSTPEVDCTMTVPTYAQVSLLSSVCSTCHSSEKTGAARNGAPTTINFDTFATAKANAGKGVEEVFGGSMPPNGVAVDEAMKTAFYKWGLCNTPQ